MILDRILDREYAAEPSGLSRRAYGRLEAVRMAAAWSREHRRRFALVSGDVVLATARERRVMGTLNQASAQICGISHVFTGLRDGGAAYAELLVERLLAVAQADGARAALLCGDMGTAWCDAAGFLRIPRTMVEVGVEQSPRHGASMTLVRAGEERDLQAIAAMGRTRATPFRLHLDRDVDTIRAAIATKRMLAGLGKSGARELQFFIAEEGITAAAYVVLSVEGLEWTLEECGDRDASGARVGALLQSLIAREPAGPRPTIRGWLPPGFLPPQLAIRSTQAAPDVVMFRSFESGGLPPLSERDVLLWPADLD
ncbi:MAG TPA: hypothetical protein VN628_14130 [Vicinamibacterales bacterium]|nr:hypothetical protein [Vicinamibacterales bacterium]